MTEQSLGVAKIGVEIDTGKVESGGAVVRREVQSMSDATVKAADTSAAAWNRQDKALLKAVQTYGLDREGKLRWAIAQRASTKNVDELTAMLDKQVAALEAAAAATNVVAQAESGAAREKLVIVRHNGQIEESERSLAERKKLGASATDLQTASTRSWSDQQRIANQRVAEMDAAERRRNNTGKQTADTLRLEQQELEKLIHKIDPTVAALARLDEQEQQLARFRKSGALDSEGYDRYTQNLQRSRDLVGQLGDANAKGGMSARAHAAALRQVPMQFTDIFTSLAAGQSPMMVILQQGGQLKDVFGGIGPAAKAMGGYVLGLVNPFTVAAAAIGTFAVGAYQGSREVTALEASLISSGNSAGTTARALLDVANAMDTMGNVTKGKAIDALASAASTGSFTAEQLTQAATAAVQWEQATGNAVDDTIAKFKRLAEDPVAALLELDKQMGFLTDSQLEMIRNLVEQGKHTEAATEAIRLFADTIEDRTGAIVENTGLVEKAWKGVKNAVAEAWDAIKDVGRQGGVTEQVAQLDGLIATMQRNRGAGLQTPQALQGWQKSMDNLLAKRNELLAMSAVNLEATNSPEERRRRAEQVKFEDETTRQKRTQLNLEGQIKLMRESATKAGITAAAQDAREAELRAAAARKESNKVRTSSGDGGLGNARVQAIKAETQAQQAELKQQTEELRGQYQERTISANDYYKRLRALAEQSTEAEIAGLRKQQAVVQAQTGKRAASGATAQQVEAIERQIAKARTDGATAVQKLGNEEDKARQKREEGLRSYREALSASTETLQAQMDAMVARETMGQREFEIQTAINTVLAEQARQLREISNLEATGQLEKPDADARRDALRASVREQVQVLREGYAEADKARLDWMNGLTTGFANFAAESMDISGQIASSLTNAFGGMTDAIVEFTQTGKLSFSSLAQSILADLTRIAVKIAITKSLESLFGSIGGGSYTGNGSGAGSISGFGNNLRSQGGNFWTGGYTGPGGKYDKRGDVHAGEVVFSQEDVARHGGPGAVERMRLGGQGAIPTSGMGAGGGSAAAAPIINLIGLEQKPKETRTSTVNGQMQIDMLFESVDARMAEGYANGTSQLYAALNGGG